VATEPAAAQTSGSVGEDPDPARRDALNEGERCERKRCDVEREAAAFEREADQPAAIRQERSDRVKRSPQRESGQSGGGIVLTQIRNVREPGGREREDERDGGLNAHRRARLFGSRSRDGCAH